MIINLKWKVKDYREILKFLGKVKSLRDLKGFCYTYPSRRYFGSNKKSFLICLPFVEEI